MSHIFIGTPVNDFSIKEKRDIDVKERPSDRFLA